jgi:hypothetical protein
MQDGKKFKGFKGKEEAVLRLSSTGSMGNTLVRSVHIERVVRFGYGQPSNNYLLLTRANKHLP